MIGHKGCLVFYHDEDDQQDHIFTLLTDSYRIEIQSTEDRAKVFEEKVEAEV